MESDGFWIFIIIISVIFIVWIFVKCCSMISDSVNQRNEQRGAVAQGKTAVWSEYNTLAKKLAYVHELQRSGQHYLKGFYITKPGLSDYYYLYIILDNLNGPISNAINSYEIYKKIIFNMYGPKERLDIYQWSERDGKVSDYVRYEVNDGLWKALFGDTSKEFLEFKQFNFFKAPDAEMEVNDTYVGKTSDGKDTYLLMIFQTHEDRFSAQGLDWSDISEVNRKTHNEAMKMICQAISAEFGSNYILNEQGNSVYYYFF